MEEIVSMENYHHAVISCDKLSVLILSKLNILIEIDGYQISVGPKHDSEMNAPCPWDAWIEIQDDHDGVECLVIEGGAGPSGFGYCKVILPLAEADCYAITVENFKGDVLDWVKEIAGVEKEVA